MTMGTERISLSVVMFPWLAHGHISPFLELAKKLSERSFQIHICSTPINLSSIKNRITEKHSLSIQLVELHLPSLPELPPHYHTTNGLPLHLNSTLQKALKMASPTFSNILKTLNPDLLIHDVLQPWAAAVAASHNIPAVQFLSASAATVSFFHHLFKNPPGVEFPFPAIYVRDYEMTKIRQVMESRSSDKEKDGERESLEESSNIILLKSSREIEGKYIDYLSPFLKENIVPVGPLVQEIPTDEDEHTEILTWLSNKDRSSTVFVSFGSECFLSREEMEEMAHGLELSNVNFIWVIRFPMGEKISIEEALPEGFFDRVGDRGMVVDGWAPQAKILGHSNTGGFVSHCGWNSLLESMKFGVPIIDMPMHLDQPLNAKLVVEVGVGVEVVRDVNGSLHREEVAKVIREVVVEKTGEEVRKKARELSKNKRLRGEEEIDALVEELAQLCDKTKGKK